MTKGQCAEKLKEMGYDAYVDNFEVTIRVDKPMTKKEFKDFKKVVRGLGYDASFGYVVAKKT